MIIVAMMATMLRLLLVRHVNKYNKANWTYNNVNSNNNNNKKKVAAAMLLRLQPTKIIDFKPTIHKKN